MNLKKFLYFLFFIFLNPALSLPANENDAEYNKENTVVIGRAADSMTLDPAKYHDAESGKVIRNIFECLVRFKAHELEIEPGLAVLWNVLWDGKTWIFNLRKNVRFHDGSVFDAHAVVYNFKRQIDNNHPMYRKDSTYAQLVFKYVKTIKAVDDITVLIELTEPYAPFLASLTMPSTEIASPSSLEKWGDEFDMHPSGTGPFVFNRWEPGKRIVLDRNKNHWGKNQDEKGVPDRIEFRVIPGPARRFDEFRNGRIHVLDGIKPSDVKKIQQLPHGRLLFSSGLSISYLAMNTEKKPFDRIKVRHAVNHAVNKKKLVKYLYQELATPAKNPIPPVIWGYNSDIIDYEYDPPKALALLAEEGFDQGFDTTLFVMKSARPYLAQPAEMARIIRGNLERVGIRASVKRYDWKTYLKKIKSGEHDMAILGWIGDSGDPDNFLYSLFDQDNTKKGTATNRSFYKNDVLHHLLVNAQQALNRTTRAKYYKQAQKIIHEEAPWVPIAHTRHVLAHHRNISGVIIQPSGAILFHDVRMR